MLGGLQIRRRVVRKVGIMPVSKANDASTVIMNAHNFQIIQRFPLAFIAKTHCYLIFSKPQKKMAAST